MFGGSNIILQVQEAGAGPGNTIKENFSQFGRREDSVEVLPGERISRRGQQKIATGNSVRQK